MDYVKLIVLAVVVALCLIAKIIIAIIVASKNVSTSKAKIICNMFDFNPLSIFFKE